MPPSGLPLALLLLPPALYAQSPALPVLDTTYRLAHVVRVDGMNGDRTWCHVTRVDSSGFHLIPRTAERAAYHSSISGEEQWMDWRTVHRVVMWRRGERGRSTLRGALIGLGGGFVLGTLFGVISPNAGEPGDMLYVSPVGGGVIIGVAIMPITAGIGAVAGGRREKVWVRGEARHAAKAARLLARYRIKPSRK